MKYCENLLTGVFVGVFAEDAFFIFFAIGFDRDEKSLSVRVLRVNSLDWSVTVIKSLLVGFR